MTSKCKACEKEFETEKQLHAHLKAHGLLMVEYYQKYYPRHDLHDGSIIKFKNKKQYLEADFNSKTNLRVWLKSQSPEERKKYCFDILKDRKEKKELIYAPCQVELRTIMSPPVQYFEEEFGDYYRICNDFKYKNKYKNFRDIVPRQEYNKPEYKIFIDTREQKPLKFERSTEIKTLKYGDYSFSSKIASCNCYIERKSLSDFIGTMSGGYERFLNEIKKSQEDDAYMVVLVEETLQNALSFQYLPHISKK